MAYLKIFPIKVTVEKAIEYISKPEKTDEQLLISTFGCTLETAALEFAMTREMGKRNVCDRNGNLAFHLIQSFRPGEVTPEKAHELGKKFADQVLKGKYEYVLSTHIDKDHVHNHIILNATNFVDYHKYVSNKRDYRRLCTISNRLCHKYGLTESFPTSNEGKTYKEFSEDMHGRSWKGKLKFQIDKALWNSVTYEEFLLRLKLQGYEIREGKNLAFRAPHQINFTNVSSLGDYYSEESLFARIEKNRKRLKIPKQMTREVRVFIDISSYVTSGNRAGFERWAKLHNLKEAAKTFNYLSNNNLLNYDDFQNHTADVRASIDSIQQKIADTDALLQEKQLIQKHCSTYRHCRQIVAAEKDSSNPEHYKAAHHAEYRLHESSKKALHELGITKLPSTEHLQKDCEKLHTIKTTAEKELQKLQQEKRTIEILEANMSSLLNDEKAFPPMKPDISL